MKVAFPIQHDLGLESVVYGHFGSAERFIIADTRDTMVVSIENRDREHLHGECQPSVALNGMHVDAVVVGGIGLGALLKLRAAGVRVYRAVQGTVKDNLDLIESGRLPEFSPEHTCLGHGHQGGCSH